MPTWARWELSGGLCPLLFPTSSHTPKEPLRKLLSLKMLLSQPSWQEFVCSPFPHQQAFFQANSTDYLTHKNEESTLCYCFRGFSMTKLVAETFKWLAPDLCECSFWCLLGPAHSRSMAFSNLSHSIPKGPTCQENVFPHSQPASLTSLKNYWVLRFHIGRNKIKTQTAKSLLYWLMQKSTDIYF